MTIGTEFEERKLEDSKISPIGEEPYKVRVSTRWDLNPPILMGAAGALIVLVLTLIFSTHPVLLSSLWHAIASPFIPTSTPETQRPETITGTDSGASNKNVSLSIPAKQSTQKIPNPVSRKSDQRPTEDPERVPALQEQVALLEQNQASAAQKTAEALASAKIDAQNSAQQAADSARLAQEESEKAAHEREAAQNAANELARATAPRANPLSTYTGPRFGTIVWQGEVHGTELITIDNGSASIGTITGRLPGVPVLVQPVNNKKVGIASSPAPGNNYRSMVFRISGNGPVQLTFQWSLP